MPTPFSRRNCLAVLCGLSLVSIQPSEATPQRRPATKRQRPAATKQKRPAATTQRRPAATTPKRTPATTKRRPATTTKRRPAATTQRQPAATQQPTASTTQRRPATGNRPISASSLMDPAQHPSAATAQEWRRNQNSKRNRSMGSRVLGPIGTGAVPRQQPLNGMLNPSAPLGDVNGISPTPAPFDPGLPPTVHTPSRAIPRIP